jgi:hypothetical protein
MNQVRAPEPAVACYWFASVSKKGHAFPLSPKEDAKSKAKPLSCISQVPEPRALAAGAKVRVAIWSTMVPVIQVRPTEYMEGIGANLKTSTFADCRQRKGLGQRGVHIIVTRNRTPDLFIHLYLWERKTPPFGAGI